MKIFHKAIRMYRATGGIILVLIILVGSVFFVMSGGGKNLNKKSLGSIATEYRIDVLFDIQNKKLLLDKITTIPYDLPITNQPDTGYTAAVINDVNQILYSTPVSINEEVDSHIETGENHQIKTILSVFYLPYYPNGTKIAITKDGQEVLNINIPQNMQSLIQPPPTSQIASGIQVIALTSDGLTESEFNAKADEFIAGINNVAPYGDINNVFEFRRYYNTTPLGCTQNILGCITGSVHNVDAGLTQATGTNKYVVFSKGGGPSAAFVGTGPAVIDTTNGNFAWQAKHEFLGHMIGKLNDRYYNARLGGASGIGLTPSNCSTSPQGESWWKTADPASITTLGCETATTYAPYPNDLGVGNGNAASLMSTGGSNQFDPVERYWIQNCILSSSPSSFCSGSGGSGGTGTGGGLSACEAAWPGGTSGLQSFCAQSGTGATGYDKNTCYCKCPSGILLTQQGQTCNSTGGGNTCTPNFPGGYAGFESFCRQGGADGVNNSCTDCKCNNGKPWPNNDNNCVISTGGGGGNSSYTINITVDKASYNIGAPIKICFESAGSTALVKFYDIFPDQSEHFLFQGNIDGGANGCIEGLHTTSPGGRHCYEVRAQKSGVTVDEDQACFNVIDNALPTRTPTPTIPPATPTPTLTPTRTPTPTMSPTPVPSTPTATPTTQPSATPTVTIAISPTVTITPQSPSPTSANNSATIAFAVNIVGIGSNTNLGENNSPVRTRVQGETAVFDETGNELISKMGPVDFVLNPNSYSLTQNSGFNVNTGVYTVKVRLNNTLWKAIYGVRLERGKITNVSAGKLVSGDLNQDNIINLMDYNIMISCYGTKQCTPPGQSPLGGGKKQQSDLNLDGKVDEKDLNIFYSSLANREGD